MPSEQDSPPDSPAGETIRALREALRASPDNAPLRKHLAQTLVSHGYFAEAEREFRHLLNLQPEDDGLKLQLARAFQQQGKRSQALVIVEDLIASSDAPARAYLLQARLFYSAGDVPAAVAAYHEAVEHDPSVEDSELCVRLGIGKQAAESEVVDGRLAAGVDEAPPQLESETTRPKIKFADVGGISDVLEMWIGSSERNLHALFEQARARPPRASGWICWPAANGWLTTGIVCGMGRSGGRTSSTTWVRARRNTESAARGQPGRRPPKWRTVVGRFCSWKARCSLS